MSKSTTPISGGDRGVSELVGVVLLFGIVIAGSALIFMSGSAVTEEVRAEGRVDAAESTFLEIDGSIQSLSQKRGSDRDAIDLGSVDPDDAEIRESGQMTIMINENSACSATMDLSALEYQDNGGSAIIYEAGAVWKQTESGLVTAKSPELGFRDGSLRLRVVRLDGVVENEDMNIDYNRTESVEQTEDVQQKLFSEDSCRRPENVTITVQSDYHDGWQNHLQSENPEDISSPASDTVSATFSIDKEYDYVDFTGDGPDRVIWPTSGADDSFVVGETAPLFNDGPSATAADTTYSGTVTFLGGENARADLDSETGETNVSVSVDATKNVSVAMTGETEVTVENVEWYWDNETKEVPAEDQPPLEVAFVLDESGSMDDGKLARARTATRGFLGVMNDSQGHRVSLIGYDTYTADYRCEWYYDYDEREYKKDCDPDVNTYVPFTEDQSAVSSSLSELEAGGFTPIPQAIEQASDEFRAKGTDDKTQIMVLVTDGKDTSRDRDPVDTAREEIPEGVTVYTIGVGSDVNDGVLQDVAAAGADDSKYISVDDAEELDSVFERIAKNETKKTITVPNKEKRIVPETKTVEVEKLGSENVTINDTIGADEDVTTGDTVTFSEDVNATDSEEDVTDVVKVERTIYYINETETEEVTKTATADLVDGKNETEVTAEVTLGEDRTKEVDKEYEVLTWPTVSMAMNNGSSTIDLWNGNDLNAPTRSVESGAYQHFVMDSGEAVTFDPSFQLCSEHDREEDTIEHDGETYNETTCTSYEPGTDSSASVHVYNNTTTIDVAGSAGFQTDLTEMLTVDGKQYYKTEGGDLKAWNLDENQVLVVVEAADSGGSDMNNVVMLVEVGQSRDEVSGEYLVNVEVTSVVAEEDDDDD